MIDENISAASAKLTRTERFLMHVSPRLATARYYQRIRLEQTQRAYEAVELSRLRKKRVDSRSADQVGSISADKLRYQARFLDENHDVAKSVLNTLVANVVGKGIQTFPTVKRADGQTLNDDVNRELMRLWRRWGKRPEITHSYTWERSQQLAARSWFRDGELFSQYFLGDVADIEHSSAVPFSFEMMEADYCPTNVFSDGRSPTIATQVETGNIVRQGVEKNARTKKPEAFYFWREYPTELQTQFSPFITTPINISISLDSENLLRVDAERVAHLKLTDRVGQTRGISSFASVYTRLDDLKDYEESERIAARISAAFAFAITKSIDAGPGNTSGATWREMDIAPGIIADTLAPGEKVENVKPDRPSNLVTQWRTTQLRSVSGGTRAGFSSLAKEYEGSYSSQRQELMEQFVIYGAIRDEFVGQFISPTYENFVLMAVTAGLINLSDVDETTLFDAEHVGRGAPYIEPQREVNADEKKVQAGFMSRHQIILERGGNPLETNALIQAEREADEEAGLVFSSTTPGDVGVSITADAGDADEDETDDDTEPGADDDTTDDEENVLEGTEFGGRGAVPFIVGRKYKGPDGRTYRYTANGMVAEEMQRANA